MAKELTVSMVYGQALLEASQALGTTELVNAEAGELADLLDREPELFRLICTPVISGARRKQAVKEIFDGRLRPELVNLLYVMIDKDRAGILRGVLRYYEGLVREEQGMVLGTVVSARPLSEEQKANFEQETGKLIGKKVRLENQVEPRVLGGVRIMVEGKVLDTTVETRLKELTEQLA